MRLRHLAGRVVVGSLRLFVGLPIVFAGAFVAGLSACSVADLPPLDVGDTDGGDVPDGQPDGDGVDPKPPPWSCEARDPLAMQWGTSREDEATAMAFFDDRLWVGGYQGAGNNDPAPSGDSLGFVVAIGGASASGSVLGGDLSLGEDFVQFGRWDIDVPGRSDAIEGFAERDGDTYVLGRTTGALSGHSSAGHFDIFVARLDESGALAKTVQLGSERPQHPRQLVAFGDDWLVGGFDDIDIDGNYVRNWTNPVHAIVAGDLSGGDLRVTDTLPDDMGGPVAASADIADAYFVGTHGDVPPTRGVFVSRLNTAGQETWRVALTRFPLGNVAAIRVDSDGRLVVAGTTYETIGQAAFGGQDLYVAVLDPADGDVISMTQFGSPGDDWVTDMALGPDGRVHVVGETNGAFADEDTGDGGENHGGFDAFVVSLKDGVVEGVRQRGTSGDEHPTAIAVDSCGRVYISGYTNGALAGNRLGGRDAFVLEVR